MTGTLLPQPASERFYRARSTLARRCSSRWPARGGRPARHHRRQLGIGKRSSALASSSGRQCRPQSVRCASYNQNGWTAALLRGFSLAIPYTPIVPTRRSTSDRVIAGLFGTAGIIVPKPRSFGIRPGSHRGAAVWVRRYDGGPRFAGRDPAVVRMWPPPPKGGCRSATRIAMTKSNRAARRRRVLLLPRMLCGSRAAAGGRVVGCHSAGNGAPAAGFTRSSARLQQLQRQVDQGRAIRRRGTSGRDNSSSRRWGQTPRFRVHPHRRWQASAGQPIARFGPEEGERILLCAHWIPPLRRPRQTRPTEIRRPRRQRRCLGRGRAAGVGASLRAARRRGDDDLFDGEDFGRSLEEVFLGSRYAPTTR